MSYAVKREIWKRIFAVPTAVVDRHIRMSGEVAIKVLLIILRCQDAPSEEHIAAMLGGKVSGQDVRDAVRYWMDAGVLSADELEPELTAAACGTASLRYTAEQNITADSALNKPFFETENKAVEVTEDYQKKLDLKPIKPEIKHIDSDDSGEQKLTVLGKNRMRLHTHEINQMAKDDENIAFLLQEAQLVMSRPLTPVMSDTVVALYSYYGMAPDVVLMLIGYCVNMEKDSMRYVEKVAADWLEKGINTHEKAEEEILRATQSQCIEGKIKAAFGIYDRKLVANEQAYIRLWTVEFGFDMDVITAAFERSVEIKGKLSFQYINGILKNWHEHGVKTVSDAMREIQSGARKNPAASHKNRDASYEISELEQLIRDRRVGGDKLEPSQTNI